MQRRNQALIGSTCLIVNPAAGRGAVGATLPFVRSAFAAHGIDKIYESNAPGDEERIAARAVGDGVQTIVAVGGDGTCGRIANVILQSGAQCRLAVVPTGTGNDFAKMLGLNRYSPAQIAELVVRGDAKQIDVGLADGHYFINSCGFGFDSSVLEATSRVRFLKGDAVYVYSALRQLFTYRGVEVTVKGAPDVRSGSMLMVTVSNGRWLGGAFRIAPQASVFDGKLDACFLGDSSVLRRFKLFLAAMRGTHIGMPSVSAAAVEDLTLTFPDIPLMEIDGELRRAQSRTVNIKCVPRALSVVAAPGALV
jgi:diacylglycerol kinase (ATP)